MKLLTDPFVIEDGELIVPDRPGWGCDIDEDVVRAHPLPPEALAGAAAWPDDSADVAVKAR